MGRRGKLTTASAASLLVLLLAGMSSGVSYFVRHARAVGATTTTATTATTATTTGVAQKKLNGKRLAAAQALYESNCARCHGADGRGQTVMGRGFAAPNLTDAGWWKKTRPTDRRLTASLRHGRGLMPGFGGQLSKSEIAALVAFARTFDGK
jgi:mono/diheme cytochrome c family protein